MKNKKFISMLLSLVMLVTLSIPFMSASAGVNDYSGAEYGTDFAIELNVDRDIRVLQLTDPQLYNLTSDKEIETECSRNGVRAIEYKRYLRQLINGYNPDLILVTGDLVLGSRDTDGRYLKDYISFMDEFEIPWAPILGNHEAESEMGVDWQCEQLENSKYCLFKQRTLTGNGNYTVGVVNKGELKRVFFMLDSGGCHSPSEKTLECTHFTTEQGFGADQIEWYTNTANEIKSNHPDVKITFAFHIQPNIVSKALGELYGYNSNTIASNPINLESVGNSTGHTPRPGDFGYVGTYISGWWDLDYSVWEGIKALGTDSILVGHCHQISISFMYEGVRIQYGQKSSTYDSENHLHEDGSISGSSTAGSRPIIGGTTMPLLATDGSIHNPYILYYEEPAEGPMVGNGLEENQMYTINCDRKAKVVFAEASILNNLPDGAKIVVGQYDESGKLLNLKFSDSVAKGDRLVIPYTDDTYQIRLFVLDLESVEPKKLLLTIDLRVWGIIPTEGLISEGEKIVNNNFTTTVDSNYLRLN